MLDPSTNTIATVPANQCNISANSFAVDNTNGLAIGGGQITGLGGTGNALPTAGDASAIALGNGAATAAGTPNAIAIGAGAQATTTGGVALGSDSVAARPAQTYTDPITGASLTTTVGAVSVGRPGQERQITDVAAGSQPTDAVNVGQLQGAITTIDGRITNVANSGAAGPIQYSNAATPTTPNGGIATNDVTLVGANATTPVALHNVAPGVIAAGGTDAANTGQLNAGNQSIATIIGGGAAYNTTTGAVTNPNYTVQGTTYTTIGGALNALNSSVNGVGNEKYFQVNSAGPNAQANAPEAVAIGASAVASGPSAIAIGGGAAATGTNSVALGAGSTDGGVANVVSVGAPGAERRITNVAAGTLAAGSTDAVTGGQLYTTNAQVASLGHSAVQYATDSAGNTLSSVTLTSDQGGPVTIHNLAPGVVTSDAATVGQVQAASANSVQYTVANGVRTNTIALAGGGPGGVTISNLAAGVGPSDAVNVAQLQGYGANLLGQSEAYTNQQVSNLAAYTQRQIRQARADAAGGTALALAATGLRYDDRPGKTSITGATSYYHDQAGIAFGIGHTSEDGRYRFNASLTASPTMSNPDVGAVVGASMALN